MSRRAVMQNVRRSVLAMVAAILAVAMSTQATAASQPATSPATIPSTDITTIELGHQLGDKSAAGPVFTGPVVAVGLAPGPGFLWTTVSGDPAMLRVDTATGSSTGVDRSALPSLIVGDEGVWLVDRCPKELDLVDTDTLQVVHSIPIPLTNCGPFESPVRLASRVNATIWVVSGSTLLHVDTPSGTVAALPLPHGEPSSTRNFHAPVSIAADDDGVWVTHEMSVWHVSAATDAIDREFPQRGTTAACAATATGVGPGCMAWISGVALHGPEVWVTTAELRDLANPPHGRFVATRIDGGPPLSVRGIALLLSDDEALWAIRYPGFTHWGAAAGSTGTARVCQVDSGSARSTRCDDLTIDLQRGAQVAAGDGALWLGIGSQLMRIAAR